jgi:hypothetical protein
MPRLDTVLVLLLATPAVAFANGDSARTTMEQRPGPTAAVDLDWAERDARELREFIMLTAGLKNALRDRMPGRYRGVNEDVLRVMDRETGQASVKAAQAAREATLWRVFRAQRLDASITDAGHDMLQAIDDRYPSRDDVSDHDTAIIRHDDMVRIGTMAGSLRNDVAIGDRAAMKRNLSLAEQFLAVMRRDAAATERERSEDRAQLGEDGRERRTGQR